MIKLITYFLVALTLFSVNSLGFAIDKVKNTVSAYDVMDLLDAGVSESQTRVLDVPISQDTITNTDSSTNLNSSQKTEKKDNQNIFSSPKSLPKTGVK